MKEKDLNAKIKSIRGKMKLLDSIVHRPRKEGEPIIINERQADAVREVLKLLSAMSWQLALNSYKELVIKSDEPIDQRGCGLPVRVRPCNEKYGDKTYFGILMGEVPLHIHAEIEDEVLSIGRSMYNPAIFVPELKEVVYGYGSWWGEIASEDELRELITDETIENVWYVKLLQQMEGPKNA